MFWKNKFLTRSVLSLFLLTTPSLTIASDQSFEGMPVDTKIETARHLPIQDFGQLALINKSCYQGVFQHYYGEENGEQNYKKHGLPSPSTLKNYPGLFQNYSIQELFSLQKILSSIDFISGVYSIFQVFDNDSLQEIDLDEAFQNFVTSYFGVSYIDNRISIINHDDIFIHSLSILGNIELHDESSNAILNYIEGGMESYLDALKVISRFNLERNEFHSGERSLRFLPPEIGNLVNVTKLILADNNLISLPSTIEKIQGLEFLSLTANSFANFPHQINNLRNLKYLHISKNSLSSLPTEIGTLSNLKELQIQMNQLENLPIEIGTLENLEYLIAHRNNLRSIPVEKIANLPELKSLMLKNNPLELSTEELDLLRSSIQFVTL
jgi:hypothetical protein